MALVYNVVPGTFNNYGIRNGDLIAIINFLSWFRKNQDKQDIRLHLTPGVLINQDYIFKFYEFLCAHTDFFSKTAGQENLPYHELMLWDFRDLIGDHAVIKNNEKQKRKLVIFPVYDAEYHSFRNWSIDLTNKKLEQLAEKYPDYDRILCAKDMPPPTINLNGFKVSTKFFDNLFHIMESEIFVGGDTGTSHFASVLDPGPRELIYLYNGRGMIHTLPFYLLEGRGRLEKFWLNFYSTTYKGDLVL